MQFISKTFVTASLAMMVLCADLSALTPPVGATDIDWDEREQLDLTKTIEPMVFALYETAPVPRSINEDAADDPAIWVHSVDAALSKIVGTDKRGGLAVYDLKGNQVQYLEIGSVNNVDIRYGFQMGGEIVDIAAASNRTTRSIDVFRIEARTGKLEMIGSISVSEEIDDVYGFALGYNPLSHSFYAFSNGKNGVIEQYELLDNGESAVQGRLIKRMLVPSQPEGMVCDDLTGRLYVGEEEKGIWEFDAWSVSDTVGQFIVETDATQNPNLKSDIEGISIFYVDEKEGYLIASSQGNHSYAVFERSGDHAYLGSFSIGDKGLVDGVEETDGIDVINISLGAEFPFGVFVAQDGYNFDEDHNPTSQNFKLVAWEEIADALHLKRSPDFHPWVNQN